MKKVVMMVALATCAIAGTVSAQQTKAAAEKPKKEVRTEKKEAKKEAKAEVKKETKVAAPKKEKK